MKTPTRSLSVPWMSKTQYELKQMQGEIKQSLILHRIPLHFKN